MPGAGITRNLEKDDILSARYLDGPRAGDPGEVAGSATNGGLGSGAAAQ